MTEREGGEVRVLPRSSSYFDQLMDLFTSASSPSPLMSTSSSGPDLMAIEEEENDDNVFTVSTITHHMITTHMSHVPLTCHTITTYRSHDQHSHVT